AGARRHRGSQRLLQEEHALGEAIREGVRVAEMRGGDVEEDQDLGDPAQLDGTLERRDGLYESTAAEGHESEAPVGVDKAGGVVDLASDPDGLFRARHRPGGLAPLGKPPGQPLLRAGGADDQRTALDELVTPITLERLRACAEAAGRLSIVPPDLSEYAEGVVHRCLEGDVIETRGDGQDPMVQLDRTV